MTQGWKLFNIFCCSPVRALGEDKAWGQVLMVLTALVQTRLTDSGRLKEHKCLLYNRGFTYNRGFIYIYIKIHTHLYSLIQVYIYIIYMCVT